MNSNMPSSSWTQHVHQLLPHLTTYLHRYDYFSLLRQLETIHKPDYGIFGQASSPKEEKIRIVHEPSLIFQSRNIQSVQIFPSHIAISLNGFGLFGASAPLPLHLTEYVYERKHQHGDSSWIGFTNIFQHRLAIQFYRAWANAQSITALDRNADDHFGSYIATFNGCAYLSNRNISETIHPYAVRYFAGLLMPQSRSATNLQDILARYFTIPVRIENNMGQWIAVPENEQTALGICSVNLGSGLLLGSKIYDIVSRFRIILGPLSLAGYRSFFKQRHNAERIKQWVHIFTGIEYEWDVQPILAQNEIPPLQLGHENQLGLTAWLGQVKRDADDLTIQYS